MIRPLVNTVIIFRIAFQRHQYYLIHPCCPSSVCSLLVLGLDVSRRLPSAVLASTVSGNDLKCCDVILSLGLSSDLYTGLVGQALGGRMPLQDRLVVLQKPLRAA